jgi:hypothetical protein
LNLINKLPSFYENDIVKFIQNALGVEADSINNTVEDTLNQFFVDDATWGLNKWEKMLGIPKNNFDYQTRKENVKAKMRSRGTTTLSAIKNICEAYSYGEVDIVVDHANYSFEVHFIGSIGVPKAFAELDKTIEEIKPAHLAHSYKFRYNNHEYLSQYTHEYLGQYTHDDLRNSKDI